ncbi:MAG TPA: hypothetical protein DCW31_01975 [Lactobacillus sp.]|nr:hypothetical protein [Lactobacillus sp.]
MNRNLSNYTADLNDSVKKDQYRNNKTTSDSDFSFLVSKSLLDIDKFLLDKDMFYAIRWLEGWERYVKDKNGGRFQYTNYDFKSGDIVLVELFGNFNPEFSYPHPAVVIRKLSGSEGHGRLLIVPMTSDMNATDHETKYHMALAPQDGVSRNSLLKFEDMRIISDKRIISKMKTRVNATVREEIFKKGAHLYFATITDQVDHLNKVNAGLQKSIEVLKTNLTKINDENRQLKEALAAQKD